MRTELLDFIYGENFLCGLCDKEIGKAEYICKSCLNKIKRIGRIQFDSKYIDEVYAVSSYENSIREAILKLKYSNKTYLANTFAKILADTIISENLFARFDKIVYIPMRKNAEAKRGYNQMQLIGESLSKLLDKELINKGFYKTKDTFDQIELTASRRRLNVKNAFYAQKHIFNSQRLLLIDDTITTGATIENFSKALKNAGAKYIIALGIANTI